MGAAFDAARRLYSEIPMPPTDGLISLRGTCPAQSQAGDFDTKSVVDLQFVRELEQSGFLKSLK